MGGCFASGPSIPSGGLVKLDQVMGQRHSDDKGVLPFRSGILAARWRREDPRRQPGGSSAVIVTFTLVLSFGRPSQSHDPEVTASSRGRSQNLRTRAAV
ncbi:hypothetical protein PCANC_17505 [Puccinia coronata f. sp. avenae]|uniref:Uncharacterized protein n=1 Tax=Puccinia coronata f. sp. avenae TaxID=200324 RepID=A0A2N5SU26_9BASI|nr:hypothetical protein PCANC_17505 [Puccinia coronata f. sp. avenae]